MTLDGGEKTGAPSTMSLLVVIAICAAVLVLILTEETLRRKRK